MPYHLGITECKVKNAMEQQRWQQLLMLIQHQQSLAELDGVLHLLLSHDERQAISGRLAIIRALLEGKQSQRQIAADLAVSIATITRASNSLKLLTEAERTQLLASLNFNSSPDNRS